MVSTCTCKTWKMNLPNAAFVFTSYARRVPFCPECVMKVCTLLVARHPSVLQRMWIILTRPNRSSFTQLISSSGVAQARQPQSSRSARSQSSTIRRPLRTSSIFFPSSNFHTCSSVNPHLPNAMSPFERMRKAAALR